MRTPVQSCVRSRDIRPGIALSMLVLLASIFLHPVVALAGPPGPGEDAPSADVHRIFEYLASGRGMNLPQAELATGVPYIDLQPELAGASPMRHPRQINGVKIHFGVRSRLEAKGHSTYNVARTIVDQIRQRRLTGEVNVAVSTCFNGAEVNAELLLNAIEDELHAQAVTDAEVSIIANTGTKLGRETGKGVYSGDWRRWFVRSASVSPEAVEDPVEVWIRACELAREQGLPQPEFPRDIVAKVARHFRSRGQRPYGGAGYAVAAPLAFAYLGALDPGTGPRVVIYPDRRVEDNPTLWQARVQTYGFLYGLADTFAGGAFTRAMGSGIAWAGRGVADAALANPYALPLVLAAGTILDAQLAAWDQPTRAGSQNFANRFSTVACHAPTTPSFMNVDYYAGVGWSVLRP